MREHSNHMRRGSFGADCLVGNRVKPVNYDISLYDLKLGGEFSYQGTVKIDLNVKDGTNEIVLNAHQLKVHGADLYSDGKKGECMGTRIVTVMLIGPSRRPHEGFRYLL